MTRWLAGASLLAIGFCAGAVARGGPPIVDEARRPVMTGVVPVRVAAPAPATAPCALREEDLARLAEILAAERETRPAAVQEPSPPPDDRAAEAARGIVTRARGAGVWGPDDAMAFRAAIGDPEITADQRSAVVGDLVVAINDGSLQVAIDGPPY